MLLFELVEEGVGFEAPQARPGSLGKLKERLGGRGIHGRIIRRPAARTTS